jgi:Flp pilus assembly protein TadD
MAALKEGLSKNPNDRDTLMALITFSRQAGDAGSALEYAERLARMAPDDRGLGALIQDLRSQVSKPNAR